MKAQKFAPGPNQMRLLSLDPLNSYNPKARLLPVDAVRTLRIGGVSVGSGRPDQEPC